MGLLIAFFGYIMGLSNLFGTVGVRLMNSISIEELVDKAKSGNHKAFEEIVRRTYMDSYTLAFRMLGNEEDARDVVQEVYLKAHRSISRFRGDSKITTWLYRITANCANTYLTKRNKHQHDEMPDDALLIDEHPDRDPAHRANVVDLRSDLTQALERLPYKIRSVVVLRDIYDLSHEKIAEELDITEAAAKVRLHRGRLKLREILYPMREDLDIYGQGEASAV